jgi:hypothetical protein
LQNYLNFSPAQTAQGIKAAKETPAQICVWPKTILGIIPEELMIGFLLAFMAVSLWF